MFISVYLIQNNCQATMSSDLEFHYCPKPIQVDTTISHIPRAINTMRNIATCGDGGRVS